MLLYLVAGELSGDAHGASLMRSLTAQSGTIEFCGAGGPEMQHLATGPFLEWTGHAVVGLWEVLKKYGYFRSQLHRMIEEVGSLKADAVVLIDYPGFNLRLAKALRSKYPGLKIIFYISPQVWAWNRRRIPSMAQYLDLMICLFPFEKELYEQSGLRTVFAGHPMLDELEKKRLAPPVMRNANVVGIFPGSREREIRKILPIMLDAARILQQRHPDLRFAIPAASVRLQALIQEMTIDFPCDLQLRNAYPLMQTCVAGMIASGTATLEASYFGLPYALLYKVSILTYEIGRRVIRVPFLGMVNILAGREIIPEFLQQMAVPEPVANALEKMIYDIPYREQMIRGLDETIATLGARGASDRAASAILQVLPTSS